MKKHVIYLTVLAAALTLSSCEKSDIIPDINPAYCPAEIKIVLPEREAELVYPDDASGVMTLPLIVGEKVQLQCDLQPDSITYKDVIWVSSNPQNVRVQNDGTVEALSAAGLGYSIISVTPTGMYSASGVNATLRVKVSASLQPASQINISAQDGIKSIFIGDTVQLSAAVLPEEATYQTVVWSSENKEIATVDNNGVVRGISTHGQLNETTHIYATARDGSGVVGSFAIRVKDIVDPLSVKISEAFDKDHYLCCIGDRYVKLQYTAYPEESTISHITWSSSHPGIATVEDGIVYFNTDGQFGEFTITATCPNGQSDDIRMYMPAGLIREHFNYEDRIGWVTIDSKGNADLDAMSWNPDGYITCTTYNAGTNNTGDIKQRRDFKATGRVWLCTDIYPIFAIKIDDVRTKYDFIKSRNVKFDMTSSDNKYNGVVGDGDNKWNKEFKCKDGSSVWAYDLTKQKIGKGDILPTTVVEFKNFQFKYADMLPSPNPITYNVYWIQSFKSIDDIEQMLKEEGLID